MSPRPQQPFRNLLVVLFVHKNLDRCASIFRPAFGLALEFFRRVTPRRMQPLPCATSRVHSRTLICQLAVIVRERWRSQRLGFS